MQSHWETRYNLSRLRWLMQPDFINGESILTANFGNNHSIHAVIFDFDGLILDTESAIIQSWQEIYQMYGFDLPINDWLNMIGTINENFDPLAELEHQCNCTLDRPALRAQQRIREWDLARALTPLPGVIDYLERARSLGLKIGLASSSPRHWVVGLLTHYQLIHYFDAVRVADDVAQIKPHPELYLSALKALKVTAAQAFALEDSPPGVKAARAAGLPVVAVPNQLTRQLSLDHASLVINSLSSIPFDELLSRISAWQDNPNTLES